MPYNGMDMSWGILLTAEVTVLNKSATAVATSNAVTVSSGSVQPGFLKGWIKFFDFTGKQPIRIHTTLIG